MTPTCTETCNAAYKDDSSCSGDGFAPDWPWTDWARRRFDTPSRYNYAKIEFRSISGVIFSPASGGFVQDSDRGSAPGPDSQENH